jgi:hypothetical protein
MDILSLEEGLAPETSAPSTRSRCTKQPTYTAPRLVHTTISKLMVETPSAVRPKDTNDLGVTSFCAPALLSQTSDTQQVEVVPLAVSHISESSYDSKQTIAVYKLTTDVHRTSASTAPPVAPTLKDPAQKLNPCVLYLVVCMLAPVSPINKSGF